MSYNLTKEQEGMIAEVCSARRDVRIAQAQSDVRERLKSLKDAYSRFHKALDKISGEFSRLNGLAEEKEQNQEPEPRPMGRCKRCNTLVYAKEGFCGVCVNLGRDRRSI